MIEVNVPRITESMQKDELPEKYINESVQVVMSCQSKLNPLTVAE